MLNIRDQVLEVLATGPRRTTDLARLVNAPVARVEVCLGALNRDGRIRPTANGWVICANRSRDAGARKPQPPKFEFLTPQLSAAATDDGSLAIRKNDGSKTRTTRITIEELRALADYALEVGLIQPPEDRHAR